jgi:hypothetical protein
MSFVRRTAVNIGFALVSSLLAGSGVMAQDLSRANTPAPLWVGENWPFPIDQWGTGRAFKCGADQCGSEVHLYLRAKIGFCRCAKGVSDDDEIDRVSDLDLMGAEYRPVAPGHPVTAGIMTGRARSFVIERPFQSSMQILGIALANKCDAVIATVVAKPDEQALEEGEALDFLRSDAVQHWAEANTGVE